MEELSPWLRANDLKSTPNSFRSVTSVPPPPPLLQSVHGEIKSGNGTALSGETVSFNMQDLDDDRKAKDALRAARHAAERQIIWADSELKDAERDWEMFCNAPEEISEPLKERQEMVDLMKISIYRFNVSFNNDVDNRFRNIEDEGSGIIEQAKRGAKEKDHEGELEEAEANAETRLTALREAKAKAEALYIDLRELKLEEAESNAVSLTTALREAETKAETLYKAVRGLKQDKVDHKFVIANLERRQEEYERHAKAVQEAEESERSRKKEELEWKLSQAKNSLQAAKDNHDKKSRELRLFMERWHKTPAGQALAGLKNTIEAKPRLNTAKDLPGVADEADQGQTAAVSPNHGFPKAEPPQKTGQARSTYPLRTACQKATSDRSNHASAPPLALVSPSDKAIIPILEDVSTAEAGSETPAAKFNPTAHPKDNDPSVASQGSTTTSEEVDLTFNNPREPPPTPKPGVHRANPTLYLFPRPGGRNPSRSSPMPIISPSTSVQQDGQIQQDGNEEPPTQIVRAQTSTNPTDFSSLPQKQPNANTKPSAPIYKLGGRMRRKNGGMKLTAVKKISFGHLPSLSRNKVEPSEPTGKVGGEPKSGFDFD